MNIPQQIFKSYDIRGLTPGELDEDAAYVIAHAYIRWLTKKSAKEHLTIVVGRDMRASSVDLLRAAIQGLNDEGVRALDIGLATTPMFYFAINNLGADGGFMITASHNPSEYNGIKLCEAKAIPIGLGSGLEAIRDTAQAFDEAALSRRANGSTEPVPQLDAYVHFLTKGVSLKPVRTVIDSGNGMAGFVLPKVCKAMGLPYAPLYFEPDGTFPHHEANPLKEETLGVLKETMVKEAASLGIAFDGDGDRVVFVTSKGELVRAEFILTLLIEKVLQNHPGAKIVYDVRCSRVVREVIEAKGGIPVLARVGHAHIKHAMRERDAALGGELTGHFYFRDFFYCDSGIFAMIEVLKILSAAQRPLHELIAPYKKYAQSGELNFTIHDPKATVERLQEHYADGTFSEVDGLTVEYPSWWFNIRSSNTEPLVRLNVEADTPQLLSEKVEELKKMIRQ